MELRSAVTLKPFDTITLPGIGTKRIGAIHQVHHDQYQIRLDEKFVESVRVDIVIGNGEHRSPERLEGPWPVRQEDHAPNTREATPGDKHLSDAELACEWWQEVTENTRTSAQLFYEEAAQGNQHLLKHSLQVRERCLTLHRFATLPFDEEVQRHLDNAALAAPNS